MKAEIREMASGEWQWRVTLLTPSGAQRVIAEGVGHGNAEARSRALMCMESITPVSEWIPA